MPARRHVYLFLTNIGMLIIGNGTVGAMRAGLSVFLFAGFTTFAAQADAVSETATALQHAYAAAQADNIAGAHKSLQRVVNCLVGPADSLFDRHESNPCAKAGKGAIVDTADPVKKKHLHDAMEMAEMGIANTNLDKAMMLATGAAGEIRASQANSKSPHDYKNEN